MPPFDGKAMAADVLAAVRDYVARAMTPLREKTEYIAIRQEDLEKALTAARPLRQEDLDEVIALIPKPKDGEPGKDADPQVVAALLRPWIAEEVGAVKPKDGEPGPAGKDADMDAIAAMVRETFAALPMPQDGKSVTAEDVRPLIVEEISNTLALVPKPKDGAPGRDAAQLEIAAAIDPERAYPRGTYAKHANGLWRAYEATEGMRGWECLVAGIASIDIVSDNERGFAIKAIMSDGTISAQSFKLPVLIYRGVFVEGRQYEQGDQVSWGAHQWHCNEPTTDKPIEGGKAWTLSVKRGRDGKEGPIGPPGKDRIVIKEKA